MSAASRTSMTEAGTPAARDLPLFIKKAGEASSPRCLLILRFLLTLASSCQDCTGQLGTGPRGRAERENRTNSGRGRKEEIEG